MLAFVLQLALLGSIGAAPYLLLSNKAPKCVSVEAAADTTLLIDYSAPGTWFVFVFWLNTFTLVQFACGTDLIIVDQYELSGETEVKAETADGLDARFDARFKQRIDTLKRAVCHKRLDCRQKCGLMLHTQIESEGHPYLDYSSRCYGWFSAQSSTRRST